MTDTISARPQDISRRSARPQDIRNRAVRSDKYSLTPEQADAFGA